MKTSAILTIVAGAVLAAAQIDKIPPCALTCAISQIGTSGCGQTDIACICKAQTFLTGIVACISAPGACNPAQIDQTVKAAQVLCASAGVTITPPGGAESTTEAPPSTTEAPVPTTEAPVPTTAEEVTSTTEAPVETTAPEVETSTTAPVYTSSSTVAPPVYGSSSSVPIYETSSVITKTKTTTICPSSTTVVPSVIPTYVPPPPATNTTTAVPPPAYTGAAGSIAANAGTVLIGAALAMFFA
ncbi:hypothetical protein ABW20_dc0101378 [Dactylellina cionopaga]|nr:hypothetical protein ABW20_dc0101378 [Dactylellina cionopaga]